MCMSFMRVIRSFFAVMLALAFLAPPVNVFAAGDFVEVGLKKYAGAARLTVETAAVNVYDSVYGMPVNSFESAEGFSIVPDIGGVVLMRGGESLYASGAFFVRGTEGLTSLGGVTYRGFLKFSSTGSGILAVNAVNIEEYLYGVIPSEMPASWHPEALKAQAVAARSYTRTQAGVHSASGYEICDSVCCQVYNGFSAEHPNSNEAVNMTAGIMAYYDGEPINAVFASSSGGFTENSENVWSNAVPYLRSVQEVAEKEFLSWTRSYSMAQISEGLRAKGFNIGEVTSVTAEYFPSGRVSKLTLNGTGGQRVYQKDAIRGISTEIDESLPSTLFKINGYGWSLGGVWDGNVVQQGNSSKSGEVYILGVSGASAGNISDIYIVGRSGDFYRYSEGAVSVVSDKGERASFSAVGGAGDLSGAFEAGANVFTITSDVLSFEGRGYGHGVGMSQYGAKGMAEAGYDYISILKHYFTNITVH